MFEVSLVIPMYNVAPYLKRCVESIAAQTFTDFEAIFVNDGSSDNSLHLCKELIAPYPNMRVVNKENGGLSSARLWGYHLSIGKYISFIDSDDYLHPDYLKSLHSVITQQNADVCMCAYFLDHLGNKCEKKLFYDNEITVLEGEDIVKKYFLPQISSVRVNTSFLPSFMWLRMFKRSILTDNLFLSERICYQEDLVFSARLYRCLHRVCIINKPLYYYCINSGSLTQKYRIDAWKMMMNLSAEIERSIVGVENADVYLQGQLLYAIHFTMMNEAKKGWKTFYNQWKSIIEFAKINKVFGTFGFRNTIKAYWPLLFAYKMRNPILLYYYNKKRG